MPLETANYIYDLVQANPPDTDLVQQGDDHLRLLKKVIQQTWPNVTGPNLPLSTGTANAQIITHVYAPTAYSGGQLVVFKAGFGNTGPCTVNVNGAGAAPVYLGGAPLVGGEIVFGRTHILIYDPTASAFVLMGVDNAPAVIQNNVGRNKLHNSMFRIQQRGTGPWTAPGSYTADRWLLSTQLDTTTVSIQPQSDSGRTQIGDDEPASVLSCNVTGNAGAGAFTQILQRVEDVRRLGGKTVTFSFYANSSAALNIGVYAQQNFGSGGSPSAPVALAPQTVAVTNTWRRFALTFTFPTIQGKTLGTNNDHQTVVLVALSSGSTNSPQLGVGVQSGIFNFWGMQLEIGSVATPLEKLDIAVDLMECKRFYQTGSAQILGYGAAGAGNAINFPLPVQMRAQPVYTPNFTTQNNCSGSTISATGSVPTAYYVVSTTTTALGGFQANGTFTASADL